MKKQKNGIRMQFKEKKENPENAPVLNPKKKAKNGESESVSNTQATTTKKNVPKKRGIKLKSIMKFCPKSKLLLSARH